MSTRKPPARWRKAKFPEAGGRWDTSMNRAIWNRDHGRDVELWRGGVKLARVYPSGNGWHYRAGVSGNIRASMSEREPFADIEDAKREAKRIALDIAGWPADAGGEVQP